MNQNHMHEERHADIVNYDKSEFDNLLQAWLRNDRSKPRLVLQEEYFHLRRLDQALFGMKGEFDADLWQAGCCRVGGAFHEARERTPELVDMLLVSFRMGCYRLMEVLHVCEPETYPDPISRANKHPRVIQLLIEWRNNFGAHARNRAYGHPISFPIANPVEHSEALDIEACGFVIEEAWRVLNQWYEECPVLVGMDRAILDIAPRVYLYGKEFAQPKCADAPGSNCFSRDPESEHGRHTTESP